MLALRVYVQAVCTIREQVYASVRRVGYNILWTPIDRHIIERRD